MWETEKSWEHNTKEVDIKEILDRQKDIGLKEYNTVAVVGVGGIGYWVTRFLAMSRSVKKIIIIDPEYVEPVNLNRLDVPLLMLSFPKVEATSTIIDMTVVEHPKIVPIHDKYASRYIERADLVIECVDHTETSERVVKDAKERGIPVISVHYNGVDHITLSVNESHGSWGEGDGYIHTPSFVVPAVMAASLAVWVALKKDLRDLKKTWYIDVKDLLK